MNDFQRARAMLPLMPSDVFDIWMVPFIESRGWPFISVFTPASGPWAHNLCGYSLNFISKLNWKLQQLPGDLTGFRPILPKRIKALARQYTTGIRTLNVSVINGPARFRRALVYIQRHGTIPKPVIVINRRSHLDLMDGNHRLAALLTAGVIPRHKFAAWVGSLD